MQSTITDVQVLQAALVGLQHQASEIDQKMAEIRQKLDGGKPNPEPAAMPEPKKRKRRKLSAAGRAAIVAALKKRWAAKKVGSAKLR